MSAGWVAGSVRARAIAKRRVGAEAARRIAACGSLADALALLAGTSQRIGLAAPPGTAKMSSSPRGAVPQAVAGGGDVEQLASAQHAVNAAVLWDMRVLAGWLPQGGAQLMRTLAGWFEIANIAERVAELSGRQAGETFRLGALATAWPRVRQATALPQVRTALAASAWRDPGGETAPELEVGIRARWAQRVAGLGEPARSWAASAVVLLLASERFGAGRRENPVLRGVAASLIGGAAAGASSLEELAGRLPRRLVWVLDGVWSPADLWRAETAWWGATEREGQRLLAGRGFDQGPVIGATVVLAADARRIGAALEVAARGGGLIGAFDAVA